MCSSADRFLQTPYAQLLCLLLACLLPPVPCGSALLVHREINTLQTSCLVGCGSLSWSPNACSCHGNQSRSVSVCHQVPGLGQLWAKATVVRAGWEEARRALGDPLSQLLFTSSWSLFSVSKHKDRSLLSDNWDQNSPVRQGPEQLTFTHIQNPFLKKKIPHYYACHLYTINSVPKIKWLLGESWCYLIGELCTCFCGLTL